MISKATRIYVAGHTGMVGSAVTAKLTNAGFSHVITATRQELDLMHRTQVDDFMAREKPEVVILAAARVGGIMANVSAPWEFIYENTAIATNIIASAHSYDVQRLVFLGSSCIYPKFASQPIGESDLLTGPLEPTNDGYALAKITGIKMCEALRRQFNRDYYALMPTNLYGPNDHFDLQTSHVIPAMLRKFYEALPDRLVVLWGSGSPMREFMHVDDLADAILFTLDHEINDFILNVGTGSDISIRELALMIQQITGHRGPIEWDTTKPDGTPRKWLNTTRMEALGWKAQINLYDGLIRTFDWYRKRLESCPDDRIFT